MARHRLLLYLCAGVVGVSARLALEWTQPNTQREYRAPKIPTRRDCIARLKRGQFDILVIGGGAVGAGVAFEAASRGLSCALVEQGDFAGQTSSKSTKLLHGGVRYLEQAVEGKNILENLGLVSEALRERTVLMRVAPHMNTFVPLLVPAKSIWEFTYYYTGMWCYHLIAKVQTYVSGMTREVIPRPYAVTPAELRAAFPLLTQDFTRGVVYYDGQMNDSRLCLTVLLTAASQNYIPGMQAAHIANYCTCESLLFSTGRVSGARVRDLVTGETFEVSSRVVINCTGPFSDKIRHMANPELADRIIPAKGSHILLKSQYCTSGSGLLIPKTKDGRLLFLLPWHGSTLVGTTDSAVELTDAPVMDRNEQEFMLREIGVYFGKSAEQLRPDVLGSFSGLRPLVKKTEASSTKELSRTHEIEVLTNGLISVMGGKWTTFRAMAEDAVDTVVERFGLDPSYVSRTSDLWLVGYESHPQEKAEALSKTYGLGLDITKRLVQDYGSRVTDLLSEVPALNVPLAQGHTYLESEVVFACRHEFALSAIDVLCRRTRLGLEDQRAAGLVLPRVVQLMAAELGWSVTQIEAEERRARVQLEQYATFSY